MPYNWNVSSKELADGSKLVKLTRTEYGLSRRTSRTVSYRLPPGEPVPKSNYQFEQARTRGRRNAARDRPPHRARRQRVLRRRGHLLRLAYVIAPDRFGTLFTLLGGHAGDDVLDLLATYHDQHGGQINDLLRGAQVAATFDNWHS